MVRSLTKTSMGKSRLPTSNSKSSSLKPYITEFFHIPTLNINESKAYGYPKESKISY